jgi:hypothetical protein
MERERPAYDEGERDKHHTHCQPRQPRQARQLRPVDKSAGYTYKVRLRGLVDRFHVWRGQIISLPLEALFE